MTVRATVAPELIDDLADLLRRVTGRAATDDAGAITIDVSPGVDLSEAERDLRLVVHRWSEMHSGIRVRVTPADEVPRMPRRRKFRRRVEAEHPVGVASTADVGDTAAIR